MVNSHHHPIPSNGYLRIHTSRKSDLDGAVVKGKKRERSTAFHSDSAPATSSSHRNFFLVTALAGAVIAAGASAVWYTKGPDDFLVLLNTTPAMLGGSHLHLTLKGLDLTSGRGLFGSKNLNPFFEISSLVSASATSKSSTENSIIYKSEPKINNVNPEWKDATINLDDLCGPQEEGRTPDGGHCSIRVSIFDWGEGEQGKQQRDHKPMGYFDTNVEELLVAKQVARAFTVESDGGMEFGKIVVLDAKVTNPANMKSWVLLVITLLLLLVHSVKRPKKETTSKQEPPPATTATKQEEKKIVPKRRPRLMRARTIARFTEWALELRKSDPRIQILNFFNQVSEVGASKELERCKLHITGVCTRDCLGRSRAKSLVKSKGKKLTSLFKPSSQFHQTNGKLSAAEFSLLDGCFDQASVFTVWRPTSQEAIRKMMAGEAVGKGLDIKGKSAVRGKLSALVPVVQIFEEKHKKMLRHIPQDSIMRLYFTSREARTLARNHMQQVLKEMVTGQKEALKTIRLKEVLERWGAPPLADEVWEAALDRHYRWEMIHPMIKLLDEQMVGDRYGLELPQRLFVEAYIMRGDCYRVPESPDDTGRPSHPSFQDMNLESLRKNISAPARNYSGHFISFLSSKNKTSRMHELMQGQDLPPRVVAFQSATNPNEAMDPKDLVIAYEEKGRVMPVVSDFDCFVMGTRRVEYVDPLPDDQVNMMKWCVDQIEQVLDENDSMMDSDPGRILSWTPQWLEVLKKERLERDFRPTIPKYGYADARSNSIMAHAIHYLQSTGCVRHGAECFNYYFPQALDREFLVVSNNIRDGGNRWAKFNQQELLEFLSQKIDDGFMFPLNPKWILCDPGWKLLYDKQLQSASPSVQQALNAWYPPGSGIRQRLEGVHAKHPSGFLTRKYPASEVGRQSGTDSKQQALRTAGPKADGEEQMALASFQLERAEKLHKAKRAFLAVLAANRLRRMVRATAAAAAESSSSVNIKGTSLGKGELYRKKRFKSFDESSFASSNHSTTTTRSKPSPVRHISRPRTKSPKPDGLRPRRQTPQRFKSAPGPKPAEPESSKVEIFINPRRRKTPQRNYTAGSLQSTPSATAPDMRKTPRRNKSFDPTKMWTSLG